MARIFVQTVSVCVCSEGFSFSAVYKQRLSVLAGIRPAVNIAVCQGHYMPSMHILLNTKRNYRKTYHLSHLTIEEQFILRVSAVFAVISHSLFFRRMTSDGLILLWWC